MSAAVTVSPGPVPTWGPRDVPVPYVARWSSEQCGARGITVRADGAGLCYRDEQRGDRDRHGVLWVRAPQTPGEGRPDFRGMHPLRQRRAVEGLLCQVCSSPADRDRHGWLFLLPRTGADPEGSLCTKPPLCRRCVHLALRHCPRLTDAIALRVRKPRMWGVFGDAFAPGPDGRLRHVPSHGYLPYGDTATPWFLAVQLVLELRGVRNVALPKCPSTPLLRTAPGAVSRAGA